MVDCIIIYYYYYLLKVWNAGSSSGDNVTFTLPNMAYNGVQTAGTLMTGVGFTVSFPENVAPTAIQSILFNGIDVCGESYISGII